MNKRYTLPGGWQHWSLDDVADRSSFSFVDGPFGSDLKTIDYTESGVRILQLQNLGDGEFVNKNKIYTSELKARSLSRCLTYPGDVIIAKMADPLARAAIVPPVENKFLIVADLMRLRTASDFDSRFITAMINSNVFRREAERLSTGTTRTRISLSVIKKIDFPCPLLSEQQKIARILLNIDRHIEKTEALIEKYQAIKQGMMHDMFTRGIDENGQLRPPQPEAPHLYKQSVVGWIPIDWEVRVFSEVVSSWAMGPRFSGELYTDNGNVATLRTTDMDDDGNISYVTMPFARLNLASFHAHILRTGDLIISRSGTCGVTAVFEECAFSVLPGAFLIRFRLNALAIPRYMMLYFNHPLGRHKLINIAEGGVQKNIRGTSICKLTVPMPTVNEQKLIIQRLDACIAIIQKETDVLEKLKTSKQGLMQDLLTGKVRVKVHNGEKTVVHSNT